MLTAGDAVENRYRLVRKLASGGMSDVWVATDETLARQVAVKVIVPRLLAQPGFGERFAAEARTLAALHHPGIVAVYDYGEADVPDGRIAYLVMELVRGEPLSRRLETGQPLDPGQTMRIVAQAAEALEAAHRAGVVHRDVKPANLLLTEVGEVILVDFGVASSAGSAELTQPGTVLGTAAYMAPEQATRKPLTGAADVYALGAVAYHCLTGHLPFSGPDAVSVALSQVRDQPPPLPESIPAPVRGVVERAMEKDPAARYASAAALAAAAQAARKPSPGVTATATMPTANFAARAAVPTYEPVYDPVDDPAGLPPKGRKRWALTVGGIAAVGVAALALAAGQLGDDPPATPTPTTYPSANARTSVGGSAPARATNVTQATTGAPRTTTAPRTTAANPTPKATTAAPPSPTAAPTTEPATRPSSAASPAPSNAP
ncbi:serine/threonine-protein kinase [Hamadaea sp. NPDC051192]|uniref:serine/threonine-protein kinase n=1 Tax=Hamadaea sp. NPDC051192 TaxID=3154940 RepID=UPI003440624E